MFKKKLKKAVSIFQWLLTAILVLVVLLLIFTVFNPIKSFQIFRVMSGSMEPKIKVGSVVFVQKVKPETLKEGNIITFTSREDPNISITHRLIATEEKEGQTVFKTRGDANNSDDITETLPGQIKGKVVFSLPFLGYLSVWIRKPLGFGLLVILPALLIIISEILNIKKAIEKEVEKKYAEPEKQQKSKSIDSLLIFFLLGIGLFQIKPTNAYFSDVVVVGGNTFSMADTWPSPPPPVVGQVVINEVYYDVGVNCGDEGDSANPDEWIELYNNADSDINLKDWSITDNHSTAIIHSASVYVPAKGFALIAKSAKTWTPAVGCWNPPSPAVIIKLGNKIGDGLADNGDRIILKDSNGTEIDAVSWGNDDYAFGVGNGVKPLTGDGKSIARKTKGVDTDSPDDWGVLDNPNPGTNPHPPEENKEEENQSVLVEEPSATPTPSPTPTTEPTPTPMPTAEPSSTPVPSTTPSPEPSPMALPEPSPSPSPEPTSTPAPTPNPTSEFPTYGIA